MYIDIHRNLEGLTAEGVARAHQMDLDIQSQHGVEYLKYWFNEEDGTVICLCRAPNMEAAERVHRLAHGLVADEIIEVQEGA